MACTQYCCQTTTNGSGCNTITIWPVWVENQTCNITNMSGNNNIWPIWCDNVTTTNSISISNDVWPVWCIAGSTGDVICFPQQIVQPVAQPTPTQEERAAHQAAIEAAQVAREKRDRERKESEVKAMELLKENLSQKQNAALNKHGWFLVEGGKSKKTYRINVKGYSGNITHIDGKKEIERFCVHASHEIPLGDHILAQMLHLLWDEDYIIGKANKTRLTAA